MAALPDPATAKAGEFYHRSQMIRPPIFDNYVKDLWRSHTRSGGVARPMSTAVGGRNDCAKLAKD